MKKVQMLCKVLLLQLVSLALCAQQEQQGYHNEIVGIQEIETPNSSKIVLSFQNEHPICNYSPASFEESNDESVHRYFMPLTEVSEDILPEDVSDSLDMQEYEKGVELVLYGSSAKKIIGTDKIVFVVAK